MPRSDDQRRPDRNSNRKQGRKPNRQQSGGRQDRDRAMKGRRKTFDTDSAPTAREREALERRRRGAGDEEPPRQPEEWIDEGPLRKEASRAVSRGGASRKAGSKPGRARSNQRRRQRATKRAAVVLELDRAQLRTRVGNGQADRILSRFGDATAAFAEDRYADAKNLLKPIARQLPDEPAVRELYGLTLYRLGNWRLAATEFEAFVAQTGSTEQHPVLADCYRALRQHARVDELWEDLADTSPSAALVAEGRIVRAGSLADRGKLPEAIRVLEAGALGSNRLADHQLRMRYVLADLYDRAGDHHAARRYFESIAAQDAAYFDVQERLGSV